MKKSLIALFILLCLLVTSIVGCTQGKVDERPVCTCTCCCGASSTTAEPHESATHPTTDGHSSGTQSPETTSAPTTNATTSPETTSPSTTAPETDRIPQGDDLVLEFPMNLPSATYSGLAVLKNDKFIVTDPNNKRGLSNSPYAFSFGAAKDGKPHSITVENQKLYDSFGTNTLAWDNKTSEKVLYLTFDCGYKYKDLDMRILNTLAEKNVKATFFVTIAYARTATVEMSRMISDGHIIGNHTANHPSDCSKLSREALALDILELHNYVRANYGYSMEYFRFPGGNYSHNNLELIDSLGYKTAFWSIAHADWDPEDQPGVEVSFNTVTGRLHPGAVILLHSTSPDNVEMLGRFIDYCRAQGYEFRSLDQYEHWHE